MQRQTEENTYLQKHRTLCSRQEKTVYAQWWGWGEQRSVSVIAFGSLLVRCFGAEFALVCHFTLLQYLHLTYRPRCGCTACIKWFMSKFKPRSGLIVSSIGHPLGGPCLKAGLLPLCIAVKAGCPEKCHELIWANVTFISPIKISVVAVIKFYTKHSLEWPSRKLTFRENIHQENASIDFGVYLSNCFWTVRVESRIVWGMKFCDMPCSHKRFKV